MIRVEALTEEQDSEVRLFLDGLALESPSVLAYHYPFHRDILEHAGIGEPVYLGARSEGRLIGFLPCFRRKATAGSVYSSLPFFGPNAGVLCGSSRRDLVQAALLTALHDRAREDGALACSVYTPFLNEDFAAYDLALPGAAVVEKTTLYLPLTTVTLEKTILYDIRKAERSGTTVSSEITDERVSQLYSIYEENCRDHGIPQKPRAVIEGLADAARRRDHVRIYFALRSGETIAGLIALHSPVTASYYLPCTAAESRSLQPMTLLIHHAIENARSEGLTHWNWEASPSPDSGVYRFKKKWGSRESRYRVYAQVLGDAERLQALGAEGIAREFPYFFVYPFERLQAPRGVTSGTVRA